MVEQKERWFCTECGIGQGSYPTKEELLKAHSALKSCPQLIAYIDKKGVLNFNI